MGLFKQMKDASALIQAAPGLVQQSQQLAAQAQQAAVAQQMAAQRAAAAAPAAPAGAADLGPAHGVSLELYARIAKQLGAAGTDPEAGRRAAAAHGIDGPTWDAAVAEWTRRMTADPSVGQAFHAAWTAA